MNTSKKLRWGMSVLVAGASVPVLGLAAAASADGGTAANVHRVAVVKLVGRGEYPAGTTDASMLEKVDAALDYWEEETDDAVTFVRPHEVVALASDASCTSSADMRAEAEAKLAPMTFSSTSGDHLVLMMPASCRTSGGTVGSLGDDLRSGGYLVGPYDESSDEVLTYTHELGHNFGLAHAHAMSCAAAGCDVSEYGDRYSGMGVGVTGMGYSQRALSSFERAKLGLTTSAEVRNLALDPGRRTRSFDVALRGRGATTGLRGVSITDPLDGTTYSLDFRNGLGRDAGTYLAKTSEHVGSYWFNKGVTVQRVLGSGAGSSSLLQAFAGPSTDGWHYALRAGETFTSSAGGVQLQVNGLQLTGSIDDVATLRVTLTDPSVPLGTQTGTISIDERGAVGSLVTATTSGWEDATVSEVKWYDDGVAIAGAVGPTFTIPAGMDGHRLTATVTGTRESYADLTATSNTLVVGKDLLSDGDSYQIRSSATGRLVSSNGPRTSLDNVQALVVDPSTSAETRWTARQVAPGVYQLKSVASAKCLDDERSRTTPDKPIIVWSCTSGVNQQWTLAGSGTGYVLVNQASKLALTPQSDDRLVQSAGSYTWTFARAS